MRMSETLPIGQNPVNSKSIPDVRQQTRGIVKYDKSNSSKAIFIQIFFFCLIFIYGWVEIDKEKQTERKESPGQKGVSYIHQTCSDIWIHACYFDWYRTQFTVIRIVTTVRPYQREPQSHPTVEIVRMDLYKNQSNIHHCRATSECHPLVLSRLHTISKKKASEENECVTMMVNE